MASLVAPHWEAVHLPLRELLGLLGQLDVLRPFYLAGGTALALRLGHRISQDLDLFADIGTLDDHLRRSIVTGLRRHYEKYLDSGFGMRVLIALVDFDIADQQEDPILLRPMEWEQVKAFFLDQARRLGQGWFGRP